jgi:hypothetical protein
MRFVRSSMTKQGPKSCASRKNPSLISFLVAGWFASFVSKDIHAAVFAETSKNFEQSAGLIPKIQS